jgi:hypothetical protein
MLYAPGTVDSRGWPRTGWVVRRATAEDAPFMADMLVEAANLSAEWKKKKSRLRVLSAPATAHYVAGWPRDTDLGVIAEADGAPVGAAWLRFLPATDPGYGFVAPDVPELTIGVAGDWRPGRGPGPAAGPRRAGPLGRLRGPDRVPADRERPPG